MKKILAMLAALLMLAGCAHPTIANRPIEVSTPSPTKTISPTATPKIINVSQAKITINETNTFDIAVQLVDGKLNGLAVATFDGADIASEYEYIAAVMYYFSQLGISDYSIIGSSGEDTIGIMIMDGEAAYLNLMPDKYKTIEPDGGRVLGYAANIANAMDGKDVAVSQTPVNTSTPTTDATEEPAPAPTPEITQPVNSNMTISQKNALDSAKSYLSFSAFSYKGLIEQLEYENYSHEDAVYAADNCGADWNEQALKSAKSYLSFSAFSYTGLIEQLEYEGFTSEQATYGADNCGADWNEQAAKSAKSYLSFSSFSRDGLIEQLEYEGFTHEQAVYGVEANGY